MVRPPGWLSKGLPIRSFSELTCAESCAQHYARAMWSSWTTFHRTKSAETLRLIQKLGAHVLFLPAYSPDLNPIEKMWSKLKEFLRSAQARSQPALIQAMASALAAITPQDAMNWFASCGYSFIENALKLALFAFEE